MFTKNNTLRGLIGTAVDLRKTRICLRLYKGVPILLEFRGVTLNTSEHRLVVSLGSAAGLWMERRSGKHLHTILGAYCCENVFGEE